MIVTLLVLAALVAGGWFGWRAWRGSGNERPATVRVCRTPTAAPSPPAPKQVTLAVLNASPRVGLAHQVAAALRARGFHVARVGNTSDRVTAPAAVRYAAGAEAAARTVAEQVVGSVLVPAPAGGVVLELGPNFRTLAAADQVASARARDVQAASPSPPVCTPS